MQSIEMPSDTRGGVLADISNGIVALHKEFYGKGPVKAKTYWQDDLLCCLLQGGFTRVEQTLYDSGHESAVLHQRAAFQEAMRSRYLELIESRINRKVVGFLSATQQRPDFELEAFVLAPEASGGADVLPPD